MTGAQPAIEIRPVTFDDLEVLIDIYLDTAIHHAAIVDRERAGAASVDLGDPPSPGNMMRAVPTAEFGVSVVEAYRGRGIGRALIGHLERWAAERGVERMILNVSEANEGAIRLYHDLGYRDFDRAMLKVLTRP